MLPCPAGWLQFFDFLVNCSQHASPIEPEDERVNDEGKGDFLDLQAAEYTI